MLTVRWTLEWLCVCPLFYREAGMRGKESGRFRFGLLQAAKLRKAGG
jgi:hypothetical protein